MRGIGGRVGIYLPLLAVIHTVTHLEGSTMMIDHLGKRFTERSAPFSRIEVLNIVQFTDQALHQVGIPVSLVVIRYNPSHLIPIE